MRRALPILAALAWLGATLAWLARDERARQRAFPPYSVHDTSDEGLSLARAYLEARGARVGVLTRPFAQAGVEEDAVLFRVAPRRQLEDVVREMSREEIRPRRGEDDGSEPGGEGAEKDAPPEDREKRERRRVIDEIFGKGERGDDAKKEDADEPGSKPREDGDQDVADPSGPRRDEPLLPPNEDAWVRDGGRLVLALESGWGALGVAEPASRTSLEKVHPSWPGVASLDQAPARVLRGRELARGHAIFARGEEPVVVRIPRGRGDVVALACPDVLRNDRLGLADHLGLLETLAGGGRPVVFDERSHGTTTEMGVVELLKRWGLGPLVVLLGVAVAALFARRLTRAGLPADARPPARTEAVDFVDSVAVLYRAALSREEGLFLYRKDLEHEVALRTGLRGPALKAKTSELVAEAAGEKQGAADFFRRLDALNQAFRRLDRAHRQ